MDGKTDWVEVTEDLKLKKGKTYLLWCRRTYYGKDGNCTLRGEMSIGRCNNGEGFSEIVYNQNDKKMQWSSYRDKSQYTHVCEVSAPIFTIKRKKKQ